MYCIWIDVSIDGSGYGPPEFEPIASFFGIWHEHRRGGHKGLHEFYWDAFHGSASASSSVVGASSTSSSSSDVSLTPPSSYVLLLNVRQDGMGNIDNYRSKKPDYARILKASDFNKNALLEAKRKVNRIQGTPSPKPGMNCVQVSHYLPYSKSNSNSNSNILLLF